MASTQIEQNLILETILYGSLTLTVDQNISLEKILFGRYTL
jgi:hypothetical protein